MSDSVNSTVGEFGEGMFEDIDEVPEELEREKKVLHYTTDRAGRDIFRMYTDKHPFLAKVISTVNRRPDEGIPTAGVKFNEDLERFELVYNPEFMSYLDINERIAVYAHEAMHIIFEHCTTRKKDNHSVWNVAADLTINSELPELPDELYIPGKGVAHPCIPEKREFSHLKAKKQSDIYYRIIMEDEELKKQIEENRKGQEGSLGSHEGWAHAPIEMSEDEAAEYISKVKIARQRMRENIKRCYQDSQKGGSSGNIPSPIMRKIQELFNPQIDWRRVLSQFVRKSIKAGRYSSWKRINRRYPRQHPGKPRRRQAKIAISVDQSGSVDDELLAMFFAELQSLSKIATFVVIPFSSHVRKDKIFTWEKGSTRPAVRVEKGGTNFDCVTKYVNEDGSFDGHVILTDMGDKKPGRSDVGRLWMTEEQYLRNPPFFDPRPQEKAVAIRRIEEGF